MQRIPTEKTGSYAEKFSCMLLNKCAINRALEEA